MATAKQIAARKLFAQRAKAWTLRKKSRAENPARGDNDAIHIDIDSHNTRGKNVRAKNPRKITVEKFPTDKSYVVEFSKNGKVWEFLDIYWGPGFAKQRAEMLHEDYPKYYFRVRDVRVK